MNTIIEQQLSQASFEVFEEFQARIEKDNLENGHMSSTGPYVVMLQMGEYIKGNHYYAEDFQKDRHKTRRQLSRVATALGEMYANDDFLDTEFEETA